MKSKVVIQMTAENYIEEQILLKEFPESIWLKLNEKTIFLIPYEKMENVVEMMVNIKKGKCE